MGEEEGQGFTKKLTIKVVKEMADESMRQAMEAVRDGRMGTNTAGRTFEVPPLTLKDRFSVRVRHGSKPGRCTIPG